MKIEIAVAGPAGALVALCKALKPFGPTFEHPEGEPPRILLFSDHRSLDDRLLAVSRLTAELEKGLCLDETFDFRVRNLAYSEPPPFRERSAYQPVPGLTIQPYDPDQVKSKNSRTILLDERRAFGTGRHPSTLLCLKALARLPRSAWDLDRRVVLDFGCGTGLLAMAALKLGALRCTGVEIDPDAAQTAARNVALNGMSARIEIVEGSWECVRGRYGLVLANLVASLLLRTGKRIPGHLHQDGRAVISGFSACQMESMENAFADLGMEALEKDTYAGWGCLVLIRTRSGPGGKARLEKPDLFQPAALSRSRHNLHQ